MSTLFEQLIMSFEAENANVESPELLQQQQQQQRERDWLQLQQEREQREKNVLHLQQQREQREKDALLSQQQQRDPLHARRRERDREQLQIQHREKIQMQQREHLHQLQSISNSLLDLPPPSQYSQQQTQESVVDNSAKATNPENDMSMSDLFGLSLPRGSLMGSQSSIASSGYRSGYPGQNSPHLYYQAQYDEGHGWYPNSLNQEMPGTPNSFTTPASPSTPGSVYSNPYSYSGSGKNYGNSGSSPSERSVNGFGSPSSSGKSSYRGRPIRGSPAYSDSIYLSDCNSPTYEQPHLVGFGGSRSNSPADSDTSGFSSVDGSFNDLMNCIYFNSSGHPCFPHGLNTLMPEYYQRGNRAITDQRTAMKKYPQQTQPNIRHHHCCPSGNHFMPVAKIPKVPYVSLDRAARSHRNAAALSEPTCTWAGKLPQRTPKSGGYSPKVFLGGLPWDITEALLVSTFKHIGPIRVEWPAKERPKGYAYIIFESEKQVKTLLSYCTYNSHDGGSYYYKITPKRSKPKNAQVIPWHISDSNYSKSSYQKLDPEKTVFVGALHGMLTAEGLAHIMEDLFDEVIYAGLDTDKYKYPLGSGRVTFSNKRSYKKACAMAFVEIKVDTFSKTVQIDPYIEDSVCSVCAVQHGPYFCREPVCSRYFCRNCWLWQHISKSMSHHLPMSRDSKSKPVVCPAPHFGINTNRLPSGPMLQISAG